MNQIALVGILADHKTIKVVRKSSVLTSSCLRPILQKGGSAAMLTSEGS